ncbi:MAG: hypothetical protein Tsb009_00600 [Planctomycetaceae bacterium]
MNFALIGDAPQLMPVLRAVANSSEHRITHAISPNTETAQLLSQCFSGVQILSSWEELLNGSNVEAILAAGHEPSTLEGVKHLVSSGKALFLIPEIAQDSAWIYEMSLIRDDTNADLIPVFPLRWHPSVQKLRSLISQQKIGRILHLQFERECQVECQQNATPLLPVKDLDELLLCDIDLMRWIGGEYNRITALHSTAAEDRVTLATVNLSSSHLTEGDALPEATWSARPVTTTSKWVFRVVGEQGTYTLSSSQPTPEEAETTEATITLEGPDAINVSELESCFADTFLEQISAENRDCTWTDITRDFELVEAAARSIRRRRTIDIHFEATSERSQFKTQMTAIGCGLITMTLVSVIFLLIINAMFDLHPLVMKIARIGVFVPLILFLFLQLLLFISRPSRSANRQEPQDSKPSPEKT